MVLLLLLLVQMLAIYSGEKELGTVKWLECHLHNVRYVHEAWKCDFPLLAFSRYKPFGRLNAHSNNPY